MAELSGWWAPLAWSRDGTKLALLEYISINDSRIHLLDVATGEVERLTSESPTGSYREVTFSADGRSLYVTSDRDGEFVQLYEVEIATGTWRPLTADIAWNVEELALSADGRHLAFVVNTDGYFVLRLLDTRRRTHTVVNTPKGKVSGLRAARQANVFGLTVAGPTSTGDAYTYDVRRRKLVRWTESERGGLPATAFVEPSLVHYPTFDERQIPAFYYRPAAETAGPGPYPVLVTIHGGPEGQATARFDPWGQFMVSRGFALLVPNVRGSDGYGKTYLTLDNGAKREDSVKDIGALLDWIADQPELDAARVGVLGGSYGGYMTLATLVHYGDRVAAGVDWVGISSFVTFLENTSGYRRDVRRAEYGDERDPEMRALLERISPLTNADKIRSPLFVAQGANDPRVPASEAEQIVEQVRGNDIPVWFMLARNEGHGFRKRENRDTFRLLMALFFEAHLRGP